MIGFGSGSGGGGGGGAGSAEAASEPKIETLVSFRGQVRNAALEAAKGDDAAAAIQVILATCDDLLPTVGARLEDRSGGTRWNRKDPEVMMKEIAEKKAKETEMRISKLEKKLVAKEKELDKVKASMVKPTDLFRTDEFKEWDEAGVPTCTIYEPLRIALNLLLCL